MATARELYNEIKRTLADAGHTAAVEANVVFETAAGKHYADYIPQTELDGDIARRMRALAARRAAGEPLQYLAGRWPFLDFELETGPGVLIPRPETENTAQAALGILAGKEKPVIIDLCSGSGCIAIALQRALPDAAVTAIERYDGALVFLRHNTARLAPCVIVEKADVMGFEARLGAGTVDLLVSNPPYVTPDEYRDNYAELAHEPEEAFLGGGDGLDFYRYIIAHYRSCLKADGAVLFETGFTQTCDVEALFEKAGYREIETLTDSFGLPRMVTAAR